MALSMHIDESGTHPDSPILAVAGYIAKSDTWALFDAEWMKILSDLNTHLDSPLKHFHMNQFVGDFGEYRSLKEKPWVKAVFLGRIVDCIRSHALGSFAVAFRQSDYVELIGNAWKKAAGSPYTFGLRMCMFLVAEWVRNRHPQEKILYVMERGNQFEKEADSFIRATVSSERVRENLRYADHTFTWKDIHQDAKRRM